MSQILSIEEMVALEKKAIAGGVDPWELMQDAARQMARVVLQKFPQPGRCRVFAGKGNNAGDALVLAALLRDAGWMVEVVCPFSSGEMAPLAQRAWADWLASAAAAEKVPVALSNRAPFVVIDGLLGIGAVGDVRQPIAGLIRQIREERGHGAVVITLDLPSGLGSNETVMADHTVTVGFVKSLLLADAATSFVGRISVLPLRSLPGSASATIRDRLATARSLRHCLPPRPFEQHKGQSGRVALVAGSLGTAGAAVLAATGALRAGAGLVSLYCPPDIHAQVSCRLPPEIMARSWQDLSELASGKHDVLAIGPGLDPKYAAEIIPLILATHVPLLLDAGALTMLAAEPEFLHELGSEVLITPHPGEMERLFPQNERTRADWARDFVDLHDVTLLLKGARTIVAGRDLPLSYNSTGHPGMATGGMGDTLSGVCAALLGQKLAPFDAARLGAWVCGRAAEIAIFEDGQSQESLLPTDLDACLGRAFTDLRAGID